MKFLKIHFHLKIYFIINLNLVRCVSAQWSFIGETITHYKTHKKKYKIDCGDEQTMKFVIFCVALLAGCSLSMKDFIIGKIFGHLKLDFNISKVLHLSVMTVFQVKESVTM